MSSLSLDRWGPSLFIAFTYARCTILCFPTTFYTQRLFETLRAYSPSSSTPTLYQLLRVAVVGSIEPRFIHWDYHGLLAAPDSSADALKSTSAFSTIACRLFVLLNQPNTAYVKHDNTIGYRPPCPYNQDIVIHWVTNKELDYSFFPTSTSLLQQRFITPRRYTLLVPWQAFWFGVSIINHHSARSFAVHNQTHWLRVQSRVHDGTIDNQDLFSGFVLRQPSLHHGCPRSCDSNDWLKTLHL